MHKVAQMLSESIARFKKLIYGAKHSTEICDGPSPDRANKHRHRNLMLLKQSKWSGNLLLVKILQTLLQSAALAASWNLQYIKEKVKLSFSITANADAIRFFINIPRLWVKQSNNVSSTQVAHCVYILL